MAIHKPLIEQLFLDCHALLAMTKRACADHLLPGDSFAKSQMHNSREDLGLRPPPKEKAHTDGACVGHGQGCATLSGTADKSREAHTDLPPTRQ